MLLFFFFKRPLFKNIQLALFQENTFLQNGFEKWKYIHSTIKFPVIIQTQLHGAICKLLLLKPFQSHADIAVLEMHSKEELLSLSHMKRTLQDKGSLFPMWWLVGGVQANVFIKVEMIPKGNGCHLSRFTNFDLQQDKHIQFT